MTSAPRTPHAVGAMGTLEASADNACAAYDAFERGEFLSREECQAIFDRCVALAKGGGKVEVELNSTLRAGVQWARNRAYLSKNIQEREIRITRIRQGARGFMSTTQLDDAGLRDAVRRAEQAMQYDWAHVGYDQSSREQEQRPILRPTLWSDATMQFNGERRGDMARQLIEPAEAAGLLAAGQLRIHARINACFSTGGTSRYYPTTRVIFSTTVRDPKGTGSGWAGIDDFDVTRCDFRTLGQRAVDKCKAAINPVAVEPGRYTTILEPQAVADLWAEVMGFRGAAMDRPKAEEDPPQYPFAKGKDKTGRGRSKIGDRVIDPRVTVFADPMDPQGGFLPFRAHGGQPSGQPFRPVSWIEGGVLRELEYDWYYALGNFGHNNPLLNSWSWRMSGGPTSKDEMIATTKRGLLVTRFHDVRLSHQKSVTCTGYTRDGIWLIEDGKITKPVKNFRFVESPLFVFNKVEQIGPVQRVCTEAGIYRDNDLAWIAPVLKVQDFNFTQLADAV